MYSFILSPYGVGWLCLRPRLLHVSLDLIALGCGDNTPLPTCGQRSAETSRQAVNLALIVVLSFRMRFAGNTAALGQCTNNGR